MHGKAEYRPAQVLGNRRRSFTIAIFPVGRLQMNGQGIIDRTRYTFSLRRVFSPSLSSCRIVYCAQAVRIPWGCGGVFTEFPRTASYLSASRPGAAQQFVRFHKSPAQAVLKITEETRLMPGSSNTG